MDLENRKKAEQAVLDLLEAFGIDRPGLAETPKRVVARLEEAWAGERVDDEEIAAAYAVTYSTASRDMVVAKGIEAFSWSENDLSLLYNMNISVGYLPRGCIIGLSKITRIVDIVCRRLQMQERIGFEIAGILNAIVGVDVVVRVEAVHSGGAIGAKSPAAKTVTFTRSGAFQEKERFEEFLKALEH